VRKNIKLNRSIGGNGGISLVGIGLERLDKDPATHSMLSVIIQQEVDTILAHRIGLIDYDGLERI
jgi:hypothetical protein